MLELRQFRQFIAVAEELNFHRAAERLHMSQPPLTQALQRMEKDLGVQLVERSNRSVRLTQAGTIFLDEARRTMAQAERAVTAARQAAQGFIGFLRIVFVSTAMNVYLPPVLRVFHQQHPDVLLKLHERTSGQQVKEIQTEWADVGFLMPPLLLEASDLQLETVFRESLVAALPRQHRLAGNRQIQLQELANEAVVMLPALQGPGLYAHIMIACARAGFTPRIVQEAHHMRSLIGLVAAEIGVTIVPASLCDPHQTEVVFRELYDGQIAPQYDLAVAWRAANTSPVLQAFLAVVRTAARGDLPERGAASN
jgi:DNA-binding transcriptional LysR family regulator